MWASLYENNNLRYILKCLSLWILVMIMHNWAWDLILKIDNAIFLSEQSYWCLTRQIIFYHTNQFITIDAQRLTTPQAHKCLNLNLGKNQIIQLFSMNLCIYVWICLCIYLFTYLTIYLSIRLCISLFCSLFLYVSQYLICLIKSLLTYLFWSFSKRIFPKGFMSIHTFRSKNIFNALYICSQFSSLAQSCPTLCNPMDCSTPGLPVHHQLPEFTQTHVHWVMSIQPSHSLSSPSAPALNLSQHQGLF